MSYVCQCSDLWSLQISIQHLVEIDKFFEDLRSNYDARSWDVVRPGANAFWATVITETVEIQEFGIRMNSNVLTSGRFQSVELPPPQQRNDMYSSQKIFLYMYMKSMIKSIGFPHMVKFAHHH